jgi:hypothetical protein
MEDSPETRNTLFPQSGNGRQNTLFSSNLRRKNLQANFGKSYPSFLPNFHDNYLDSMEDSPHTRTRNDRQNTLFSSKLRSNNFKAKFDESYPGYVRPKFHNSCIGNTKDSSDSMNTVSTQSGNARQNEVLATNLGSNIFQAKLDESYTNDVSGEKFSYPMNNLFI